MTDFRKTLIGRADSYKYSHFKQYPPGITQNVSYIEARGFDKDLFIAEPEVVFFGLQAFIKEYLSTPITHEMVYRAEKMISAHGEPFHSEGWHIIVDEFDGYLPIQIEALPEGTPVKIGTPMAQVRATDPRFAWLSSFVETAMIRAVWYPSTVATVSREAKKIIKRYLENTSDLSGEEFDACLNFRLHDFGQRGVSSAESAALGGLAHLINFMGTDTVEALWAAEDYYGAEGPVGFSIPASEHSTMTSWGKENETKAYENMIDQYADGGILACVSDSYDFENAVTNIWGDELKEKVEKSGAQLVVRPDSGDPVETPVWAIDRLYTKFHGTMNSKGYLVLNPCVRVIQGDGIDTDDILSILQRTEETGFSTENIGFGMGGGLLQKVNRDSLKFAQKTCAAEIDGKWVDVYKEPTGDKSKKSKRGDQRAGMDIVWNTGMTMRDNITFDQVRENAKL